MGKARNIGSIVSKAASGLLRAAAPAAARVRRMAAWIGETPRRIAWSAGIPVGFALFLAAVWGMERSLSSRPEYKVRLEGIRWEPLPPWLSPQAVKTLSEAASDAGREPWASIFDDGLPERVGKRLERLPWVKRVAEVRKSGPASLAIRVEWREPYLAVRCGGVYFLDREGTVLPQEGYQAGAGELPMLVGFDRNSRTCPPLAESRTLQAVYEAMGVYEREGIARDFPQAALRAIDVSGFSRARGPNGGGTGEMVLHTVAGVAVRLTDGRGPGRLLPAEQVANLRTVLARDPGLSAVREYVDVRFEQPAYR